MYEKVLVIYVLHMTGTISLSSTVNRTIKITVVIRHLTHIKKTCMQTQWYCSPSIIWPFTPKSTLVIRPDSRCTEIVKYYSTVLLKKGNHFYKTTFSLQKGGFIKGGPLYNNNQNVLVGLHVVVDWCIYWITKSGIMYPRLSL
jgi:hypothetical protein